MKNTGIKLVEVKRGFTQRLFLKIQMKKVSYAFVVNL